jgi:hypothetical protein
MVRTGLWPRLASPRLWSEMPKRAGSVPRLPVSRHDSRPKNKLLAGLPAADFQRLRPHLRTIPTNAKVVFHRANEPVHEVFFPNGGVASVTAVMKDGAMVEIATVGDEGLVGISALFGSGISSAETMMQVPDIDAAVMSVEVFQQEVTRRGPFLTPSSATRRGCCS